MKFFFFLLFFGLALAQAQTKILTLENQIYEGTIREMRKDGQSITIQTKTETKTIECGNIVQVYYRSPKKSLAPVCILLTDGSSVYGEITDGNRKALSLTSPSWGDLNLNLTKIKEIRFKPDLENLESTDTENDVLYFKSGDVMNCLIESFGKSFVEIKHPQLGLRKEYFEKLERIVFVPLDSPTKKEGLLAIVRTMDHSLVQGKIVKLNDENLSLKTAIVAEEITISTQQIQHFSFQGGKFIYLSDLPVELYKVAYVSYFPGKSAPFLPRLDKNQRGGEISLAGQTFFKGLGVLSRTEITVSLKHVYRKFQSHIGIDDEIRNLYRQNPYLIGGSVVFEVWLDGKKEFDSGIMRFLDAPQSIDLDIANKKEMKLIVDFGENAFVNDLADWASARLIQ